MQYVIREPLNKNKVFEFIAHLMDHIIWNLELYKTAFCMYVYIL